VGNPRHQLLPQLRGSLLDYHPLDTQSNFTVQFNSSILAHHELYHATLELERLAPAPVLYFQCADLSNALAVLNDNYCDCR
jgi:hypothetical protein